MMNSSSERHIINISDYQNKTNHLNTPIQGSSLVPIVQIQKTQEKNNGLSLFEQYMIGKLHDENIIKLRGETHHQTPAETPTISVINYN